MKLSIAPEVVKALAANAPVVALESTVIAHGLPRPRNLNTAKALDKSIEIQDVYLVEKTGGKSGDFRRS